MQTATDHDSQMQDRITGQIGALAAALPHCAIAQIVQGVDDIRCLARDNGFAAVETLASRLESAVAAGGYRAAILTYLDAMSDAAAAPRGPLPPAAHEAWLASVAMRLGH
ncbi:MAG: hypothetical protein DI569_02855 [Sphingopyxis macrogoltabida]|uniref:Uncharacterized protein n=1 Tax=Sphingopyxis macrogoltabida TaxID=33050 RepID=A0A2W5N1T6_SPHMC|nr:MAG: hypothetical protein DI569_02855 [Sphingopyxis macrogoltabida]